MGKQCHLVAESMFVYSMSIVKVAQGVKTQICVYEHVCLYGKVLWRSLVSQSEVWQRYQLAGQGQTHTHTHT